MRLESMVAQQALLAAVSQRSTRSRAAARASAGRPDASTFSRPEGTAPGTGLPATVADRLASLFASDPGLAEAVNAHLPAARQASARDLAAYAQGAAPFSRPRILDTTG